MGVAGVSQVGFTHIWLKNIYFANEGYCSKGVVDMIGKHIDYFCIL